jgi:hypothetical protein
VNLQIKNCPFIVWQYEEHDFLSKCCTEDQIKDLGGVPTGKPVT